MGNWTGICVTIVCAFIASSGFWAFAQKRFDKDDATKKMLRGLGHDRIMELAVGYLERGDWITQEEYENLHDYLYIPYRGLKGNGSAERVMDDVKRRLKIVKSPPKVEQKTTEDL